MSLSSFIGNKFASTLKLIQFPITVTNTIIYFHWFHFYIQINVPYCYYFITITLKILIFLTMSEHHWMFHCQSSTCSIGHPWLHATSWWTGQERRSRRHSAMKTSESSHVTSTRRQQAKSKRIDEILWLLLQPFLNTSYQRQRRSWLRMFLRSDVIIFSGTTLNLRC